MKLTGKHVSVYGYLTEAVRRENQQFQIPELNSGFEPVYWYRNHDITRICQDGYGDYADWNRDCADEYGDDADRHEEGQLPLTYVVKVETEGSYRVQVTLYAEQDIENAMIFLGRRRLAWRGRIEGKRSWTGTFAANICPIIPRTYTEPMEDLTLDVTVIGAGLHLAEIKAEPFYGRTLYIAGDSTVADQSADYPYLPGGSYCGWGQMLSAYLPSEVAVSNHAHSGLTTESFRSEGHYQILFDRIQAEDICLFQFGHNDQKLLHLMAEGGYRENLIRYIQEIRGKGAYPVLVTPLARNSWRGNDGTYNDLLEPYAQACIHLGEKLHVPVIRLHEKSMSLIKAYGCERAKRFFYPSDYTHSNDYGALRFAWFVYEELLRVKVLGELPEQDAFAWEPPERLPQRTIPEKYAGAEDLNAERLFEDLERPEAYLTRAEALELVITAMHFFPTNVYNDMFTDVIGHERYAGMVECAWQNGLLTKAMMEEREFHPLELITGGEFADVLTNGYHSRQTTEQELPVIFPEDFSADAYIQRGAATKLCRQLHI